MISPDGDGANDVARVRFRLARASYITTTIHQNGTVVRRLAPARIRAGLRTVSWDGSRSNGEHVAPGRYTLRVAIRQNARRWRFLNADIQVTSPKTPPAAASSTPTGDGAQVPALAWPVAGAVTSGFGYRGSRMHHGIDIPAKAMTPIGAAAAGIVRFAGVIDGYGNSVIIDHEGGYATLYAHQAQIATTQGAVVAAGDVIGYVGHTGSATTDHLHLELHDPAGTAVDPRPFLPPR